MRYELARTYEARYMSLHDDENLVPTWHLMQCLHTPFFEPSPDHKFSLEGRMGSFEPPDLNTVVKA